MSNKVSALLIDRAWCTGCQSCEIACRNEHGWDLDTYGIRVEQLGPAKMSGQEIWDYIPVISSFCDMCEDRVANGGIPTCALHCLANVIHYGEPEELARMAAEKGMQRPIIMIR